MDNYLDFKNIVEYEKLKEPAKIIRSGGIVVFPTETVYGIGTNGLDENAVKRLYDIKNRPLTKPISLLVSDMTMINEVAQDISELEYRLMESFFPGPLTLILQKKNIVPDILTANQDTVGIRMPSCEITRKLVQFANVPIAAPSANISNKPSGTNLNDIMPDFKNKVDYFIDAGESKLGIASTIVKVINDIPHILRQGSITKEQIEKVIGKEVIDIKKQS